MSQNHMTISPQVSILIPVFNKLSLTRQCLQAIENNTPHDIIEVIVIDNASTDGTFQFLTDWKGSFPLKVIRNEKNKGYAKANNQGARKARGRYLVLLNNDTEPKQNWLSTLLDIFAKHKRVGAVGSKLLYPNGTIQHAGVTTVKDDSRQHPLIPIHLGHGSPDGPGFNKLARFPAVTGACMMVPKTVYQDVGGLDEFFWNGYEDVDFCFKLLEADFDIYYQPNSVVIHYESQSGDQRFVRETENFLELIRRWRDKITCQFDLKENKHLIPNNGVTIVIVTYNSKETIIPCLDQLDSTLRENDEVVIVDNASKDQTQSVVRNYIDVKGQYHFIENTRNLGYSHAANIGACAGQNPYIIFLNPDTLVTPQWIDRLLTHAMRHKTAAVGPVSNYVAGQQKVSLHLPQAILDNRQNVSLHEELWKHNAGQSLPDKLLIGFCLMVKRKIFDLVGGMDNNLFLGNDDLDLSLRLRDAGYRLVIATDTLVYHKGQESFNSESKDRTDRWVQESSDYLYYKLFSRFGKGNVPSAQDLWGIDWFRPLSVFDEDLPLTSMIMLTYNQLPYTRHCIESIFKHTHAPFELIVVDNGSTDATLEYISNIQRSQTACVRIKIVANQTNQGFARGCNQGFAEARGQQLLLINNDVVVTPNWLSKLSRTLSLHQVGFSGPMSNNVSGHQMVKEVQYNTHTLSGLDHFADTFSKHNAGQINHNWHQGRLVGFCMLIKRELIEKIGGLDEAFRVGNFEDDDFCLRASLSGFKGAIARDCFVHHFGNQSYIGNQIDFNDSLKKNWGVFKSKWGIPSETPYTAQYHVPHQSGGFDKAKHYMPIVIDQPQSQNSQQDNSNNMAKHIHFEDNPTSMAMPKNELHNTGGLPGGKPMQILNQVFDTIKQHLSSEKSEVSIWILERIIESSPQHSSAHHELGMLFFEQEELSKAQSHLQKAVRFCPDNPKFIKDLGDFFHVVVKDNARAIEMYEKAIAIDPVDGQLILTAAHLCTAENLFEKANHYYQRVLEIEPDNQDAKNCFLKLKDCTDTNVDCDSVEAAYGKAQSQIQSGNKKGAACTLKAILASNPEHALAHNDYAVLAYEAGDKTVALDHYEKAVSINPENILFLKNLADFYWCEQGNGKAAMELNVRVLGEDPVDIETILSCAQICMAFGKNSDARDFVNRAIQIDPLNDNAEQIGKQLDAIQSGQSLPADRNTLYQQANKRAGDGDLDGAVEVLTQLVTEHRNDAEAFNSLGILHYELGQNEKALSCYREAVRLNPGQDNFVKNLADFYLMEKGQAENAMKLYLSVLENKPHDVDCLIATGMICVSMNKAEDARVFFERVMEIEPTNTTAMQALQQMNGTFQTESPVGADLGAFRQGDKMNAAG